MGGEVRGGNTLLFEDVSFLLHQNMLGYPMIDAFFSSVESQRVASSSLQGAAVNFLHLVLQNQSLYILRRISFYRPPPPSTTPLFDSPALRPWSEIYQSPPCVFVATHGKGLQHELFHKTPELKQHKVFYNTFSIT